MRPGKRSNKTFENTQWKKANATSLSENLTTHSITHSGEKTNKCDICNYMCFQTGDLRRHLKTHSGEMSNKCNQCDQASDLTRHLKTHRGEKQMQQV